MRSRFFVKGGGMIASRLMTPETLERLETKIAFLESANAELSDVVYRQKKEIDELRARLGVLAQRFDAAQAENASRPYTLEEEKPPHY
jgi:SlyX protein